MDAAPTSPPIDAGARLAAPPSVTRVVYASQSKIDGSVYAEMESIRASAMRHNPPVGVATALLYQSGWFVQWKEGPAEAMQALMARVAKDRRHHSLRIIHASLGPRLLDGPWSMAIVQRAEKSDDMTRRVLDLCRRVEDGVEYAPPAIWRQLSTPMRHVAATLQSEPDAFQRVLVCASFGAASSELVRWLARSAKEEVVQRRFAGSQDRDVSTDLVDFVQKDRVMRVVSMARAGLSLPLTRAFMPDYSHVLLLLSGNSERDLKLVQWVASACAGLMSPPALLAVAAHGEAHAQPLATARRLGLIYVQCQADPDQAPAVWAAAAPLLALWQDAANSGPLVDAPARLRR